MSFADTTDHGGAMDRVYRGQRHIYDLTRKYYLLGRDQLIADLRPEPGTRVLELGCGTGRNLIVAARRYPDVTFYGVDASQEMLKSAHAAIRRAGLDHRIHVAHGFAETVDPADVFGLDDHVDVIFFSYSLSMIPNWRGALDHAISLLPSGGRLLTVDFGDQAGLPTCFRDMLFAWLAKFHVTPRLELAAYIQERAEAANAIVRVRGLFRHYAVCAELRTASVR